MLLRHVSAQFPKDCRKEIGHSSIGDLQRGMLTAKREENAIRTNLSRMLGCVNVKPTFPRTALLTPKKAKFKSGCRPKYRVVVLAGNAVSWCNVCVLPLAEALSLDVAEVRIVGFNYGFLLLGSYCLVLDLVSRLILVLFP